MTTPLGNLGPAQFDLANIYQGSSPVQVFNVIDDADDPVTPTVATITAYSSLSPADAVNETTATITTGRLEFDLAAVAALDPGLYPYVLRGDDDPWLAGHVEVRPVNAGRGLGRAYADRIIRVMRSEVRLPVAISLSPSGITVADGGSPTSATSITFDGSAPGTTPTLTLDGGAP